MDAFSTEPALAAASSDDLLVPPTDHGHGTTALSYLLTLAIQLGAAAAVWKLMQHYGIPGPARAQMLRAKLQRTKAAHAHPSILLRLLDDPDLAIEVVKFLAPRSVGCVGLTCCSAAARLQQASGQDLARQWAQLHIELRSGERPPCYFYHQDETGESHHGEDGEFERRSEAEGLEVHSDSTGPDSQLHAMFMHPSGFGGRRSDWNFHRIYLYNNTPVFNVIPFQSDSDELQEKPHIQQIWRIADWLCAHPGLVVRVDGYARQGLPEHFGKALAQARATRVRQALLVTLRECANAIDANVTYWEEFDDANEGIYIHSEAAPLNFDQDVDAMIDFYETHSVGSAVRAEGCWPKELQFWSAESRKAQLRLHRRQSEIFAAMGGDVDDPDILYIPSSVVEVTVFRYEPHSRRVF